MWSERFVEFLQTPTAQLVIWSGVLVGVVIVGFYVISKFRPTRDNESYSTSDWITHFRELHASGVLAEEEFRTIKTKLARQLQEELELRPAGAESASAPIAPEESASEGKPDSENEAESEPSSSGNGAPE